MIEISQGIGVLLVLAGLFIMIRANHKQKIKLKRKYHEPKYQQTSSVRRHGVAFDIQNQPRGNIVIDYSSPEARNRVAPPLPKYWVYPNVDWATSGAHLLKWEQWIDLYAWGMITHAELLAIWHIKQKEAEHVAINESILQPNRSKK